MSPSMPRSSAPRLIVGSIAVVSIALGAIPFKGRMFAWVADSTGDVLSAFSGSTSRAHAFVQAFVARTDLARRIIDLEEENGRLRAQTARQEEEGRQLDFYRDLGGIRERFDGFVQAAGIFAYARAGGVRQAIMNRGSDDGVNEGDVIATSRGALIGIVARVYNDHAAVRMVGDVALEVTGRVSGSDVAGLVRTNGAGAVLLDLIQKDEAIAEGATVVTSGDDRYPAGLIIGTVRSVDTDAATLFKIVHLAPAVGASVRGQVILLRP